MSTAKVGYQGYLHMLGRQVRGRVEVVNGCFFDVLGFEANDGRELEWRASAAMAPEVPNPTGEQLTAVVTAPTSTPRSFS